MWSRWRMTKIQSTSRPDHIKPDVGQELDKPLKEEKNKNGQSRNQNSNTPGNWEEFIQLIRLTKNTKTTLRMQGESWRHQRQLQCHVKDRFLKLACGKPLFQNYKNAKAFEAKTRFSCITEAHESTRQRIESVTKRIHEERIAGKGQNSVLHYNLVHKFIPMPQAMKIPDAKAAVDKEWEKLEMAWQLTKVRNKKEVIDEARNEWRKFHFASLMDLCHLKNSELEPQFQKYKGRVVIRGDIVKDDSGSYAVFTEQGSSASQMTAAKIMDIISRLPGCAGQAADAVSANTQVKMEGAPTLLKKTKVRMSRYLDTSTEAQMAKIMVQYGRSSCSSWAESVRSSLSRTIVGKAIWESFLNMVGKKFQIGNAYLWTSKKDHSCLCMWTR